MKKNFVWFAMFLFAAGVMFPGLVYAVAHPAGTNVVNNGTIFMITQDGHRRPYTSAGAFLSYGFNSFTKVEQASPEDLALPEGAFIPPRDGKIVCSDRGEDKGTCYLITNGKRAAFTSGEIFKDLGFNFAKTLTGDVSFLDKDTNITNSTSHHCSGVLIKRDGTIFLVSSEGLMGIPSMDVLATWGYSLDDVVPANNADGLLSQSSVISPRQGSQLKPQDTSSMAGFDEDTILKAYIDTYPDLPQNKIASPSDAAQVLYLFNQISSAETFKDSYPFMTTKSLEMLGKAPKYKNLLEIPGGASFVGGAISSTQVDVFEGGQFALFTYLSTQTYTHYVNPGYLVFFKENGTWKLDFIGSLKYEKKDYEKTNPTGEYVTGTGSTYLALDRWDYTENPKVNDPKTRLLVVVKNSGDTTIHQFRLGVELNHTEIYENTLYYELKPKESILFAVPLDLYWSLPTTVKTPGQYRTDLTLQVFPDGINKANEGTNFYFNETFK